MILPVKNHSYYKKLRAGEREAKARERLANSPHAKCVGCRAGFPKSELTYGPDPFASEIYNDNTCVYLCKRCHHESCMDI